MRVGCLDAAEAGRVGVPGRVVALGHVALLHTDIRLGQDRHAQRRRDGKTLLVDSLHQTARTWCDTLLVEAEVATGPLEQAAFSSVTAGWMTGLPFCREVWKTVAASTAEG